MAVTSLRSRPAARPRSAWVRCSIPASTVVPVLVYPDVRAAVAWLEEAFGFAERVRVGEDHRAQLAVGDGAVIVADVGGARTPPAGDVATHLVMVRIGDARRHCERAEAAGARVVDPLAQGGGGEAGEHDGVGEPEPGAGQHRDDRLGHHRHVEGDAVTRFEAEFGEVVCGTADFGEQLGVGDGARVARFALPMDGDLVAGADVQAAPALQRAEADIFDPALVQGNRLQA